VKGREPFFRALPGQAARNEAGYTHEWRGELPPPDEHQCEGRLLHHAGYSPDRGRWRLDHPQHLVARPGFRPVE